MRDCGGSVQPLGCGQIQTDAVRTTYLHRKLQRSSSSVQHLQLLHSCSQAAEYQSKYAAATQAAAIAPAAALLLLLLLLLFPLLP
jgi:hypothetical protein